MPLSPLSLPSNGKTENSSRFNSLEFLATVSHEIRNPLNAVIGISRLLAHPNSEQEREQYVDSLLKTSENLLELLNNIMDYSRLESRALQFNYNPTDLSNAIQESLSVYKTLANSKGLEFFVEVANSFPSSVIVDKVKFNQVVTNLVSNAVKFTEEGSVTVGLKMENLTDSTIMVECIVKDTGIGIPEEKLQSIFEPFEQISGDINMKYGGTGLGLSISQKLIHAMNGRLTVMSKLGAGSEFRFKLPLEVSTDDFTSTSLVVSRGTLSL